MPIFVRPVTDFPTFRHAGALNGKVAEAQLSRFHEFQLTSGDDCKDTKPRDCSCFDLFLQRHFLAGRMKNVSQAADRPGDDLCLAQIVPVSLWEHQPRISP